LWCFGVYCAKLVAPAPCASSSPANTDAARCRCPWQRSSLWAAAARKRRAIRNALAAQRSEKGISQQAWGLRENIGRVAAVAESDPRLIEVHPEVSFAALAGGHMRAAKTTWNGQMDRRAALARAGVVLPDDLGQAGVVPVADVLDAAAVAWSARRFAAREARSFPAAASPGDRQVIWY